MQMAEREGDKAEEGYRERFEERRKRRRQRQSQRERPNKEASCPFCGKILERPHAIGITALTGFKGGACTCGTIYLFDENGFHGGDAIVEILTLLYGDWETAWQHTPDEDYEQRDLPYDERNHRIAEPDDTAKPAGVLYFARKLDRDG